MKKRWLCLVLAGILLWGCCVPAVQIRAASEMTASEELLEVIKAFEGFSGTPYRDTDGKFTIGYGTRCPDDMVEHYNETPMTKEEADAELRRVVATYEKEVNAFLDRNGLTYQQQQFDAVISLVYNIGSSWLKKGDTLISALVGGASGNELIYAFSIYSISGGKRSVGHVRRRLAEAAIYLDGVYGRTPPANYTFVLYDPQGGEVSAMGGSYNVQGYDSNLTAQPIATAVRPGYLFMGWFTSASGGTEITLLDGSTASATLYAHWEIDPNAPPQEPEGTPADPDGMEPVAITVTKNQVNVRKGPGLSQDVVDMVNKGDRLTVTAIEKKDGYTWGKTEKGWVALENTDYVPAETPAEPTTQPTTPPTTKPVTQPPTEPEEPEEPIPEGDPINPVKVTVKVSSLNIRKGPGVDYENLGQLSQGEKVTVSAVFEGPDRLWGRFEKGWIALENTDYAQVTQPPAPTEPPTVPEPTEPEPTDPPTEPTTQPPTEPSTEPTEPPEETPPEKDPAVEVKTYATVIRTGKLNVRKTPKGTVVGALRLGDRVEILEQQEVDGVPWGRCEMGWINMRSYVRLEQVEVIPEPPQEELPEAPEEPEQPEIDAAKRIFATVVSTGSVPVLDGPEGNRVTYLLPGERVELLEQKELTGSLWGRCAKGWIRLRANVKLETVEDAPQKEEEQPASVLTYAQVKEESLSLLTEPGGTESGRLFSGDRVLLTEYSVVENTLWGRCAAGWISLREGVRLDTVTHADGAEWTRTVTIRAACLNLRSAAEAGSPVVCRLYQGTTVTIRQMKAVEDRIWARTDFGWINMDFLV